MVQGRRARRHQVRLIFQYELKYEAASLGDAAFFCETLSALSPLEPASRGISHRFRVAQQKRSAWPGRRFLVAQNERSAWPVRRFRVAPNERPAWHTPQAQCHCCELEGLPSRIANRPWSVRTCQPWHLSSVPRGTVPGATPASSRLHFHHPRRPFSVNIRHPCHPTA